MTYAPIVLFVYNRLDHTKKTVEALQNNYLAAESELFIFADGAKGAVTWILLAKTKKSLIIKLLFKYI